MQNTEDALITDNKYNIHNIHAYIKSAVLIEIGPIRNSREVITTKQFMTIHYQSIVVITVNGQHI